MRVIFPSCPKCDNRQFVGRVKTSRLDTQSVITAYFCSNCLTEFTKDNEIMRPLLTDDNNFNKYTEYLI